MTTPAHTRAVAEVLAEHQSRPTGSPFCRCGWRPSMFLNDTESDRLQHVAHQADMLAAAGLLADPAHDAQVWDEGLRAGEAFKNAQWQWSAGTTSRLFNGLHERPERPDNPYRIERQEGER